MCQITLLLLILGVAHASVTVTRTSNDAPHPSTMEIAVALPDSNNNILIPLTRTDAFEDTPITLLDNGVSRTFSSRQVHHPSHSHYRDIDSKSVISVRHVNGKRQISGHVMYEGTSYFLEPVGESEHRVVRTPKNPDVTVKLTDNRRTKFASRRKRQANTSPTKYTVELRLLLDSSVWKAFKTIFRNDEAALTELTFAYIHILNGIDIAYRNIGSELSISVECIGISLSRKAETDVWMDGRDVSVILGKMKNFLPAYFSGQPADHYIAFTRRTLHNSKNVVAGATYQDSVCSEGSVSVITDWGLHAWTTAAHELAHSLGALHDIWDNDCQHPDNNLMTPGTLRYGSWDVSNSISFSHCSVAEMSSHFESLDSSNCLLENGGRRFDFRNAFQTTGTRLTLDQVCRISFPWIPNIKYTNISPTGEMAEICAHIYCVAAWEYQYLGENLRAPVGTPCGDGKKCDWSGKCT